MKKVILILTLAFTCVLLFADFDDYEPSARARALGGAYYMLSNDADGAFYNPAGLANSVPEAQIGYTHPYGNDFQELGTVAVSFDAPWQNWGKFSAAVQYMSVSYEDVDLMDEKQFVLAHGFTLRSDATSKLWMGWSANCYSESKEGMGSDATIGLNVGALAELHDRMRIGFTATNLNNPQLGKDDAYSLPQKLAVGVAYLPYDGVTTMLEMQKSYGDYTDTEWNNTEWHAGVEFRVLPQLTLRVGTRNNPGQYSAGAGFNYQGILIDYAFQTHTVLGNTHQFTLGYRF